MNGNATYNERVVVVEVASGQVKLKTGRISSTDSSHLQADNRKRTVVWGDRRFYAVRDSPEEAHERVFHVGDIHLLKEDEARTLLDPANAQTWFGAIYQDPIVVRIHRALKRHKWIERNGA